MKLKLTLLLLLSIGVSKVFAQDSTDMLKQIEDDKPQKEKVYGAFKSSRVIMSHSVEMLRPGVMDFRILHRFGQLSGGSYEFFGLDGPAVIRLGLDYGLTNNLSFGIGRSNTRKELDGFIKFRALQQSTGPGASPISIVAVAGLTYAADTIPKRAHTSDRFANYWQVLIGRKFSEALTLQLMPTLLHRNFVTQNEHNDLFATGVGGRVKLSRRISLNADYYYVFNQRAG